MNNSVENLKVAIIICTKDRPEFMARQLSYYATQKSPHPIYIADSSNDQNAARLKTEINNLKDVLSVRYTWYPPGPDNHGSLLGQVREKYACVISDDDYQIPASLTKCAQFLEDNPDYGAAGGYSVSFRLDRVGPYGQLKRLADYPRYSIEAETAAQRLIDFIKVIYSISFFVNRIDNMRKAWAPKLYMAHTMNELISWNILVIAGKSKLLDCLSLVRQIHSNQYPIPSSFDWITDPNFHKDHTFFKDEISRAVAEKDNIDISTAQEVAKEAFWYYIQKTLAADYRYYLLMHRPAGTVTREKMRITLARMFPGLKKTYRTYVRPLLKKDTQMHHEVLQPNSRYYADFKPVMDSFTHVPVKD